MASGRMLRRSVTTCEQLADCSVLARLLYTWGLTQASDWGVLPTSPRRLTALVFGVSHETAEEVASATIELIHVGLWTPFEVDGAQWVHYRTWDRYQDIRRRTTSQRDGVPLPPGNGRDTREQPGTSPDFRELPGTSGKMPAEVKRSEVKGRTAKATATPKTTPSLSADAARPAREMPGQVTARLQADRDTLRDRLSPGEQSLLDAYLANCAAENKSGKLTLSREVTETRGLVACHEEVGTEAWAYGMEAANTHNAGNLNYVKKAAKNYQPGQSRAPSAGKPFLLNPQGVRVYEPDWTDNDRVLVNHYRAAGMFDEEQGLLTDDPRYKPKGDTDG